MSVASVFMNIFGGGDAGGGALDLIGSLLGGGGSSSISPQSTGSKGERSIPLMLICILIPNFISMGAIITLRKIILINIYVLII